MKKTYTYYPGCTLRTKAKKLDEYARKCAEKLEIGLEEVEEWQCCGGVYPTSQDEIAPRLSSIRVLSSAKHEVLTVCSACHHVLKRVNYDMKYHEPLRDKANRYLELETAYHGECKVVHYLEMLRDEIGFDVLKEKVTNPLTNKNIAAYYGCLLLRPSKEMAMDDPENPTIMERLIEALGAKSVPFALRNECCGGYQCVNDVAFSKKRAQIIMDQAKASGADMIITACPLCLYNLNTADTRIPVYYFSEILAQALGIKEDEHETL